MADPLSITTSVVGIIIPALHGIRLLLRDLQQLSDTPKTIKRLTNDVQSKSLSQNVAKQLKATISSCTQACVLFKADLQNSVRNSHVTDEIKKTISTRQDEVNNAITTADRQLVVVETKLEELNLSSDDDGAARSNRGKDEVLRQLEEELKGAKASQKLLTELLSKSQEEAIVKVAGTQTGSMTVSFGANNTGFQAGNINRGVHGMNFGGK
ncbi:hypothetical protein BKA65DRAFT_531187 [Rhexocercosporidium sp. MPI-PUGE-AT-0058]|nr:hypothetical protein BKA65DRAFT_531187 [Rhexocercosporidium sp. MPI-PUGE-AT-0058]